MPSLSLTVKLKTMIYAMFLIWPPAPAPLDVNILQYAPDLHTGMHNTPAMPVPD